MATFLNTGVLGQQVGGSLSVGALRSEYTDFRQEVLAKKRRRSRTSARDIATEERYLSPEDAARKGERSASLRAQDTAEALSVKGVRKEQLDESEVTTGTRVDTSDVRPTSGAAGITDVAPGVTPEAAPETISPELQADETTMKFLYDFDRYYRDISGRNASGGINRARGQVQGLFDQAVASAKATGNQDLIDAVSGLTSDFGRNKGGVAEAQGTATRARGAISNVFDIDRLLKDYQPPAPSVGGAVSAVGAITRNVRGKVTSGGSSRSGRRSRTFGGPL